MAEPSLLRLANETGGRALSLPAGAVVFRPGSECPGFVVVKSGSIRVTLVSEEGREVVLYRVRPGEICLQTFACLSRGTTYAAEGVVETPVDGVLIPPAQFQKLVSKSGAFRSAVFEAIAARFSEFEHVVETLAFTGLESRVASALLRLAGTGHLVTATHQMRVRGLSITCACSALLWWVIFGCGRSLPRNPSSPQVMATKPSTKQNSFRPASGWNGSCRTPRRSPSASRLALRG